MLNEANEDGYVVLTLKNEQNEYLTLFAKILKENHKIEVESSIYYGEVKESISAERLDDFLNNYDMWKDAIDNETLIKYRNENFNVYYYISQAESVHFLKKTITDRKNAMNVLLNTGFIDDRKKLILELIGSKNGVKGCPINDEISSLEIELKKKASKLKSLIQDTVHDENENAENVDLGLYKKDEKIFFWDNSSLLDEDIVEIRRGIYEIESLASFLENENDYRNYQWNKEIQQLLTGKSINDYVNYREYIINNFVSMKKAEQQLEK